MQSVFNINRSSLTNHRKYFKSLPDPFNGALAFTSSSLSYFYPGLFPTLQQTSMYLQTVSAAKFTRTKSVILSLGKSFRFSSISSLFVMLTAISILSCQLQTAVGVKKDLNTGLKTEYRNIEPEEAMLVMNDEVLNHTDIPIGEQFTIVNKGVKGLTQKDGKVSVGCSLLITDMKGNVILNEPDLFKENGIVDAGKTEYLKCMVSTGEPMAWEEHYKVKAGFWDKWGDGKIVNEVTIRMIDIP